MNLNTDYGSEEKTSPNSQSVIEELNKINRNKIEFSSQIPAATMRNLDDKWILIQKNTFTNWINEQLKLSNEKINDLRFDLLDGVKLVKLVDSLQQPNSKVSKRYFKNPINQHQMLENVALALNAVTEDGIKLVNIGNGDITNGNLKLILGLIWHLILRYQIGKTKIPPKKLILAWIKSVLPQYPLTNLTNDLNDGIVIAGLVNYCNQDLFPDWLSWNHNEKLENCTKAMTVAFEQLDIPLVVTPSNMCRPELDELSSITYLSYYIKEGSPGYRATLKWIQSQMPDEIINNFNTDWNDGWLLCKLCNKVGLSIQGFPNLDRTKKEQNCQKGLTACRQLRIETYITAKELSDPDVESIGVMATVVQFKYIKPLKTVNEKAKVHLTEDINNCVVGKPVEFMIEYVDTDVKNIKATVKGPKSSPAVGTEMVKQNLLKCHFIPGETGRFELNVTCDDHVLDGCPIIVLVKVDTIKVQLIANEKYAPIHQGVEICINPMGAGRGNVVVSSRSPSNQEYNSKVEERDLKYYAKIYPNEIGEWITRVYYDNEEVKGSPYVFEAFDLNLAILSGLKFGQSQYQINKQISFQADVSKIGHGSLSAQLINLKNRENYPIDCYETDVKGVYQISFLPTEPGYYKCMILFNNKHIKGSPIDFNVAVDTSQLVVDFQKCKSVLLNQLCQFTIDTKDNNGQGEIKVVITNPSVNQILTNKITNTQSNIWKVEFNPTEIGEYYVDVFYANQLVNGSPFKCNVFDPNKIKIVPSLHGVVDQVVKFEVDASQAGTGQLEIAVENGRIPCNFSNQGNLRFIPSFTPRESGKHEVTVRFNSYEVPGSPFTCNVVDVNRVTLLNYDHNSTIIYPIYKTNSLELNSNDLSSSSINIKLTSPSGLQIPVSRSITAHNTLKISFQANEIGTHRLDIDYANVPITGSPFDLKIYDSSRIVVSDIKGNEVGKPCEFVIDASSAGEGQLEIAINDGLIKNQVKQIKPGHYGVTFLPIKQDTYVVDVKFNHEIVPGCPKRLFVRDTQSAKITGSVVETALLGSANSFLLDGIHNLSDLSVRIRAPSDQEFVPKMIKTNDEECRVEWTPYELGAYTIYISYCDSPVKGTPLKIKTYDPKRVQVYNINDGCVFKPNIFCVDASQAGEGSLEIGISCNGHYIPNQVKPLGNSKFEVHFLPQEPSIHYANINFNSEPVKGSPFPIKIIDTNLVVAQGKGLGLIPVNIPTSFQVFTGNAGAGQVRATVTGSKGENVHVKLYQQNNGDYIGEFTPTSIGQHRIDIFYSNQPVAGSPYFATVYDPQSCEITSLPKELILGFENVIEVDLSSVGNADFDIKITTPSGSSLPVSFEGQGHRKIKIVPNELGSHRILMQVSGQNLIGTPLTLNCIDARLPTARGDGLHHGLEDRPSVFYVDSQGMKGNLDVNIEGPQQYTKNIAERQADGSFVVKYTPVEVGLFKIFVRWNGREIPGSPFISYVVNPEKVRIIGGWQNILDYHNILGLKLYEEKIINFDTSDAGPGTLSSTIIAPNGTKLPLRLTSQGQNYSLSFNPIFEGEYKVHLLWDNHNLPNTPITAKTTLQSDIVKIEVNGNGLHEAKINQEADFVIDGSRAGELYGLPEIKLTGTRCDIDVRMMQLGHNIYRCTYIPQIPGAYLLSIKWSDRQIGDSPYKVNIGMNSDPSKVIVSGEGIKMGVFGQEIKAMIDTRRAGPGELTAHCMGPQKVAFCEFFDHKDGTFTLYVKPQEPGKHILQIKYNDEHVPGSPFIIRISGPPDASKVRVMGPGICHGVLSKFKSKFMCETRGAGAGQLTVRIRGPKGAFRVEMQRENQKDRTILCKYDPIEAGEYQINVKWSGQHVPGSPFNVHIFNHEDKLEQFLRINPEEAYALQQQQMQHQQLDI